MDAKRHESRRAEVAPRRLASMWSGVFCAAAAGSLLSGNFPAHAATDISPAPVTTISAASVKPNVMLLMDASGSMERSHMPDEAESVMGADKVGYKNSSCNSLYYNPALTYSVPRKADGSFFNPVPAFTNAPYTGFLPYYTVPTPAQLAGSPVLAAWWGKQTSSVDLSTSFMPYDFVTLLVGVVTYPAPEPAYYYKYTGALPLKYDSAPCTDVDTGATRAATGGGNWVKVVVSAASGPGVNPDERQNFANWYSYYRIRINMIKSAASLAFAPLTNNVRVGFITVEPKLRPNDAGIDASRYVPIQDFDLAQRTAWFAKLFAQVPGGASPAREGLARVGRHYGGKNDGINTNMNGDPVQYACQQNFTLMTTDGYWNAQTESPGGGPVDLNGALLGQQDGGAPCPLTDPFCPRPIFDGGASSIDTLTNKVNVYFPSICGNPVTLKSTAQITLAQTQMLKSSVTTQERTVQYLLSQTQPFAQTTKTSKTITVRTKTVTQYAHETDELHKRVVRTLKDTYQTRQDITQLELTTDQTKVNTTQTVMNKTRSTEQDEVWMTSKSQSVVKSVQYLQQTDQWRSSTTQSFLRIYYTTGCATSEGCTTFSAPCVVGDLTPSGNAITSCTDFDVRANAPDPAACVPAAPTYNFNGAAGRWEVTACTAGTMLPDRPVQNCAVVAPALANGYTNTTCYLKSLTPAVPIDVPAGNACPQPVATLANSWTITTCSTIPANNYSNPVAACPALPPYDAANNWIRVTCTQPPGVNNHGFQPDMPCVDGAVNTDGSFVTTTCKKTTDNTFPVPTGSCANLAPVGPAFLKRTCVNTPLVVNQPVASAGCAIAFSFDGVDTTTCTTSAAGPYPVATPVAACPADTGADPFIENHCTPIHTNGFVASCPSGVGVFPANIGNSYTASDCHYTQNSSDFQDPTVCAAAASSGLASPFIKATCTKVNAVAPAPVDPATCPIGTTTGAYPFVTTHCVKEILSDAIVPAGMCVYDPPTLANGWQETLCVHVFVTTAVQGPCVIGTETGVNPDGSVWTCAAGPQTAPQTNVPACVDQVSDVSNNWVTIACTGPTIVSGPTTVDQATCVDGRVDGFNQVERCSTVAGTYPAPTAVAACVPGYDAGSGESFTCTYPNNFNSQGVAACDDVTNGGVTTDPVTHATTTCVKSDTTKNVPVCNAFPPVLGNNYKDISCPGTTVFQNAVPADPLSCVVGNVSPVAPFETTTVCTPVPIVPVGPAAACANVAANAGNSWTATICGSTPILSNVVDAGCAPGTDPSGVVTTCTPGIPGDGTKYDVTTTTTVTTTARSNGVAVGVPVVNSSSVSAPYNGGVCYPNPSVAPNAQPPVTIAGCAAWPCLQTVAAAGGSNNSLADVAQYYYKTNLRPLKLPPFSVKPPGVQPEGDWVNYPHMTTFTLALGVSGTLNYRPDYKSALVGDFADIRTGAKEWPLWPDPTVDYTNPANWDNKKSIDDYWHTAVDGRGRFFSAKDPQDVVRGIGDSLSAFGAKAGSGAADGVSSLQPVSGNNFSYSTSYQTQTWDGDLVASKIDLTTGSSIVPTPGDPTTGWSAGQLLALRTKNACDTRDIFLIDTSAFNNVVDFSWNTFSCDAAGMPTGAARNGLNPVQQNAFGNAQVMGLSQWPGMTDGTAGSFDQRAAVSAPNGFKLVNFLRGQRAHEGFVSNSPTSLFRSRHGAVLGDIVGSQAVYVQKPFASYSDVGYDTFRDVTQAGRPAMVYVGANDGMLHAFDASLTPAGGQEKWAIIPSAVLPNLWKLADNDYGPSHQFFVDGSPVVGDVYGGGAWHTILVGGLNNGGKGYFAVDVTDPTLASPKVLWEFKQQCPAVGTSDCDLGLSYGKPVITKLDVGGAPKWVVMVTSGYNNLNGNATDGGGYLYVLDALTGALIYKVGTDVGGINVGTAAAPSGLAQINNYVDNPLVDNTTLRAYGGDLLGNVWRFDFPPSVATASATLVGTAKDAANNPQPITTRPELAEIGDKPFVMVGTGALLGVSDLANVRQQSVYGIQDTLAAGPGPIYADPLRGSLRHLDISQVGMGAGAVRSVTACNGNCAATAGWVLDLAESGERVNVEMKVVLGSLVFASNVPESMGLSPEEIACGIGGHSWFNQIDFRDGTVVPGASFSQYLSNTINVGFNVLQLPLAPGRNNPSYVGPGRQADATNVNGGVLPPTPPASGKRISWREVAN